MRLTATCPAGLESVLAKEWQSLGAAETVTSPGTVSVPFDTSLLYRAHEHLRCASRLVLEIKRGDVFDAASLYEFIHALHWEEHFLPKRTLAVRATGGNRQLRHTRFIAQQTKDAIVDRLRDRFGSRPDVDRDNPDLIAFVHVHAETAWAGIDVSAQGLHRRGYRQPGSAAPIRENLAAGLLQLCCWPERARQSDAVLFDPMCGSGTFVVEALMIAAGISPGAVRRASGLPTGFEAWRQYERTEHTAAQARRESSTQIEHARIYGRDISQQNIGALRASLELFSQQHGLSKGVVSLEIADFFESPSPSPSGLLVTNPPYGERLGGHIDEAKPLYRRIGDVLKQHYDNWDAWLLCGDKRLAKSVGLRAEENHRVVHGGIDARFCSFPIHHGGKRAHPLEKESDETAGTKITEGQAQAQDQPTTRSKSRKRSPDGQMFANRLSKNWKKVRKQASRERTSAFRVYDKDIPEFNLSVDWYDGHVRVEEQERPKHIEEHVADRRRRDALGIVEEILGVPQSNVSFRVRSKLQEQQDERIDADDVLTVQEYGLTFEVNLKRYLDTGLFLDGAQVRRWLHDNAEGRTLLNLFSYTCTASIAAAAGGARHCSNVDLSKTALAWGKRNAARNGCAKQLSFIQSDVVPWLQQSSERFDLIYAGIPTYSASRRANEVFDAIRGQRIWLPAMMRRLAPDGVLLLSTHARGFRPDPELSDEYRWEDRSADFRALGFRKAPLSQSVYLVRNTTS